MKRSIRLGLMMAFIYLQSCGGHMIKNDAPDADSVASTASAAQQSIPAQKITGNLVIKDTKDLIGFWVGQFKPDTAIEPMQIGDRQGWDYSNKINISIDEIKGDTVNGHSVVAGNNRPFTGTITKDGSTFRFAVNEPGDDKYDGKFKFSISQDDPILTGTWSANNKIRIPARKYTLTKTLFRYNPGWQLKTGQYVDWSKKKAIPKTEFGYDATYFTTSGDVDKYNASTDTLTTEEVANMKKADLFVLRNAIYARHGYSFKNQQLRAYFDQQPWYIPISTDIKSELTPIEKQNIALLMRYENNAKEYYDAFGRG